MRSSDSHIEVFDDSTKLASELDAAVMEVACRLGRAKDNVIAGLARSAVPQAQVVKMAMSMSARSADVVSDVEHLYRQLLVLEERVMRSRVKQVDRVAVTVARALGYQLTRSVVVLTAVGEHRK